MVIDCDIAIWNYDTQCLVTLYKNNQNCIEHNFYTTPLDHDVDQTGSIVFANFLFLMVGVNDFLKERYLKAMYSD